MRYLTAIILLLLSLKSQAQLPINDFKIYDSKLKKEVQLADIISQMDNADVLFFGEEHNDSVGHVLEFELFKLLYAKYGNRAIASFEMFHTDVQSVMDEYLLGVISEKNFLKESRPWNNYKDYKPIVEFAKTNNLKVVAANAATRYSNAVTVSGLDILKKLPESSFKYIPKLPVDTATGRYYDKFIETLGGHSMGGMKIYQTQNFWDATMAWSIQKYFKLNPKSKIIHYVGRFHSDEKLGTFSQLKKLNPKIKVLNISTFSAKDFKNPDWQKYNHLGDFVIVTNPDIKRTF